MDCRNTLSEQAGILFEYLDYEFKPLIVQGFSTSIPLTLSFKELQNAINELESAELIDKIIDPDTGLNAKRIN